jgi:hypothetical protein
VLAVVLNVSDADAGDAPLTVTVAGVAQVGALVAPEGPPAIAQVSAIGPMKPVAGVAVMVEVPLPPTALIVTAVPDNEKLGTVITGVTTCSPIVCTKWPVESVPVTTTL